MSLFQTLTGESWRRAIKMARTEPNEVLLKIYSKLLPMKKILILQSSPAHAPEWVRDCKRTVEMWCIHNGYEYIHFGDTLFQFAPEFDKPFTKIQRSDLARLRIMESHLALNYYDAVYWLDADFLIWNIYEFQLPMPEPGSVVCAREAHHANGRIAILINNSVLGFCRCADAHVLSALTMAALEPWRNGETTPPHTIAGPMVLSKLRFPLRRIIAKQAGCFSDDTIKRIVGPWILGRKHLWWLSLANGATLKGANLCSSRETAPATMKVLVADMIQGQDYELGGWKYASPIYRASLIVAALPFRIRCWLQTRAQAIRKTLMPGS